MKNEVLKIAEYTEQNLIYDMGLEPDANGDPRFYILTNAGVRMKASCKTAHDIYRVNWYLEHLNTGLTIQFDDFGQYNDLISQVFSIYCDRIGLCLAYDRSFLIQELEDLQVSQVRVARIAHVGRSTLNDLTRGITKRPRFRTVCKIHSALYKIRTQQA